MGKMYVGKYVNTHGIKGEIKILSDIDHKSEVFKIGNVLNIALKDFKIKSYRVHKNYDMVSFEGIDDINQILSLKGNKVFIDRTILPSDIIFYDDLLNHTLMVDGCVFGSVNDYINGVNPLLKCDHDGKTFYIPLNGNFIKKVTDDVIELDESAKELIIWK